MDKFTTLEGVAAPLKIINVDTDMIIRAVLKTIKRTASARAFFSNSATRMTAADNPDSSSTSPPTATPGAGRRRQFRLRLEPRAAPWALLDFGNPLRDLDLVRRHLLHNCFKNGILPIRVTQDDLDKLSTTPSAAPTPR